MEARALRVAALVATFCSLGAAHRTPNFVVEAPSPNLAKQIGKAAERYRRDLSIQWLGQAMPNWSSPCPIKAVVNSNMGAGGATSFQFAQGEVFGWQMTIQGPQDRILDSVLPHEVTHTIFASYFRRRLPRWADEGACSTVEHPSERAKLERMLVTYLQTRQSIPLTRLMAMYDYPRDQRYLMPLYAQGHSLARFLLSAGGKRKYLQFVADGLKRNDWNAALKRHYGYASINAFGQSWLAWVNRGSPQLNPATPSTATPATLVAQHKSRQPPEPNLILRTAAAAPLGARRLVPVQPQDAKLRPPPPVELASMASTDGSSAGLNSAAMQQAGSAGGRSPISIASHAAAVETADRGLSTMAGRGRPGIAGWYAVGSRPTPDKTPRAVLVASHVQEPADETTMAADPEASGVRQAVTRPQPIETPSQVILEWSRPGQMVPPPQRLGSSPLPWRVR